MGLPLDELGDSSLAIASALVWFTVCSNGTGNRVAVSLKLMEEEEERALISTQFDYSNLITETFAAAAFAFCRAVASLVLRAKATPIRR